MDLLGGYDSSDGDDDEIEESRRRFLGEQSTSLPSKKSVRRGEDGRVLLTLPALPVSKSRKVSELSAIGSIDEEDDEKDESSGTKKRTSVGERPRVGLIDQLPAPKKLLHLPTAREKPHEVDSPDSSLDSHTKSASSSSFSLKKTDPMLFPLAIDPSRIVVKKSGVKKKALSVKKADTTVIASPNEHCEIESVPTPIAQSAAHIGESNGKSSLFEEVEVKGRLPAQLFGGKGTVNIAPKIFEEHGEHEENEQQICGEESTGMDGYTLPKSWERASGSGMETVIELSRSDLVSSSQGGPPPGALPSASIIEPRIKGMKYHAWDAASGEIRESGTSTVHKRKNQINFLAQSFQKEEYDEFVKAQLGQGPRHKRGETSRHKYGW
eukprot:TRINITY_DN8111_c1_g1_i1.p1 TRINITY_DN8111_c1_g1~~TRINITY_DN8111_c1_g1_i1.p1  ORF type:complete len:409 (+),score=108.86 TRINITY_DN8111_c1_g1_i1:86-1228(+)